MDLESLSYWTADDRQALREAQDYAGIGAVAMAVARRVPNTDRARIMVCGPMTSGGLGSFEKNMLVFNQTILRFDGHPEYSLFNQVPLEEAIVAMYQHNIDTGKPEVNKELVRDIYVPLFEEDILDGGAFIDGHFTSNGASEEYWAAVHNGKFQLHLPPGFHETGDFSRVRKYSTTLHSL